jgi:threonine/homoserine/homoserine lactone efflux protein
MLELLLSQAWTMAKGGGIGVLVAAPVGPIAMLCIRTTLERGRLAGISAGLGAAVADTIFAAISAYGISLLGTALEASETWLRLIGGVVLIAFGIYLGRKQPDVADAETREVPKGLLPDFAMTLVLTLANPMTILTFIALFAGVSGLTGFELNVIPALLIGVLIGSTAWWLFLSGIVGLIRHRIDNATMLWINRGSGAAVVAFGLFALIEPLQAFAQPLVAKLMTQ